MAALDLVSEVASDAPVLLLAEDAHWLDRPTADVLAFLARRIESDPIVLVAATRDDYPSVLRDAGLPTHGLSGLDEPTAAALLDASAPELPLVARTQILRAAAGNPLALLELPTVVGRARGRAVGGGGVASHRPPGTRICGSHIRPPDATRLVLLVAALNDEDSLSEALEAGGVIAKTNLDLDAVAPASESGIVDIDLQFVRFRHPLMRSAVAQSREGRGSAARA